MKVTDLPENLRLKEAQLPPCLECSACCRRPWAVMVTTKERENIPSEFIDKYTDKDTFYMGYNHEKKACIALDTLTHKCKIYKNRPAPCRGVQRADNWCLKAFQRLPLPNTGNKKAEY